MIGVKCLKISESDIDNLYGLWQDRDVIYYTSIKSPRTMKQTKKVYEMFCDAEVFAIYVGGCFAGIVGCMEIARMKDNYGMFYQFSKEYWGKGYGKYAVGYALDYMKNHYPGSAIFADVVKDNIASEKILQKYGFKLIGKKQNGFERDGDIMEMRYYRLML